MTSDLIAHSSRVADQTVQPLEGEVLPPAQARPAKVKVKKYGFLGAFLRPIGIAIGVLVLCWGVLSMGTTYYRGYQRHLDYSQAAHEDKSYLEVLLGRADAALSTGETKFVYRDVDGRLHRVVAAKSAVNQHVNATLIELDRERDQVVLDIKKELDETFRTAFADREQAIDQYADWFFEWKRSYVILKEAIKSSATRLVQTGKYESLKEAVERDVKDYFMENYKERVLKPETRDQVIAAEVELIARRAHDRYRQAVIRSNERLQAFLADHTKRLEDIPPGQKATHLELDWDAQKWKSPAYASQDRAFDGIVGVGSVAAGGTFGALALGPLMTRTVASSFGTLSRTFVTSMGSRVALAEGGAAAGTLAAPGIGTAIGTAAGLVLGAGADYLLNKRREKKGRASFVKANSDALDSTIKQWKSKLEGNVASAVDRWFEDARASMILSHGRGKPLPASDKKVPTPLS